MFAAEYLPHFLVAGVTVFILNVKSPWRRWCVLLEIAIAILLSRVVITGLIHTFYHHPRPMVVLPITPFEPLTADSFPSGHASALFALASAIWLQNRRWGLAYLACAVLNGLARIFIGVHWPFDILGGALIGVGSAWVVNRALVVMVAPMFPA
jgi:undecaprenyl-diphosphatase